MVLLKLCSPFTGPNLNNFELHGYCLDILESFTFWDEDDYEYEIFSVLSSARAWTNVILAGKRESCRY